MISASKKKGRFIMNKSKIINNLRAQCEQDKLENYLRMVVRQATDAVDPDHFGEESQMPKWDYLVLGNHLLFYISCGYDAITKRIVYRLYNNLEKNFKLDFNLISTKIRFNSSAMGLCERWFDIYSGLDPNNSLIPVKLFKQDYTIRLLRGIRPVDELGAPHLDKLLDHGFDHVDEIDHPQGLEKDWERFEKAYKSAYGETPLEYFFRTDKVLGTSK